MQIVKIVEITSHSDNSWGDAFKAAVDQASKQIKGIIQSVDIKNYRTTCSGEMMTDYEVCVAVSFLESQ